MEPVILGANQFSAEARKDGHLSRPKISVQRPVDARITSHSTYRRTFALLATSKLFQATGVINHGVKAPLARFMTWVQKENKLLGKVRGIANRFTWAPHIFFTSSRSQWGRDKEHSCAASWRAPLMKGHGHLFRLYSRMSCFRRFAILLWSWF